MAAHSTRGARRRACTPRWRRLIVEQFESRYLLASAPSGIDRTETMHESPNPSYVQFNDRLFSSSDSSDPSDRFLGILITTLPPVGDLLRDGEAVTAGQFISQEELKALRIYFKLPGGVSAAPYLTSFTFQVKHDAVAHGGVDLDPTPNTFTFYVRQHNSQPSGEDKTITVLEDTTYALSQLDFGFSDPQDLVSDQFIGVKIPQLPSSGTLMLNNVPVAALATVAGPYISVGKFTFVPAANVAGPAITSFPFQVSDGAYDPTPNTLAVTITPVNDPPSGTDNEVTLLEDHSHTFAPADFGFSDTTDVPANLLARVKITAAPENGTLTNNGTPCFAGQFIPLDDIVGGKFRFAPGANRNGASYASFTFQVQDDGGTANSGINLDPSPNRLTIYVTPVNDPPIGTDRTLFVPPTGSRILEAIDFPLVDAMDYLPPSSTPPNRLAAIVIVGANLAPGSTLLYNGATLAMPQVMALEDLTGSKLQFNAGSAIDPVSTISFRVQDDGGTADGGVDTDPMVHTITLRIGSPPAAKAPSGRDSTVVTLEDVPYTFSASDFGFSDAGDNPPNGFKAVQFSTLPTGGTLSNTGLPVSPGQFVSINDITSGQLKFVQSVQNANGWEFTTLTFQVQDDGVSANGGIDLDPMPNTITVRVMPVDDPPIVNDDYFAALEDITLAISLTSLFGNDIDADGDFLVRDGFTQPMHGTVDTSGPGLRYVPDLNYHGPDSFTYNVNARGIASNFATVHISVRSVNDPPAFVIEFGPSYLSGTINTPLHVKAPGLLSKWVDADGDRLTAELVRGPAVGDLTVNADGSFTYIPPKEYVGNFREETRFTYRVRDGSAVNFPEAIKDSAFDISGRILDPIVFEEVYGTAKDTTLFVPAPGLLANDSEPTGLPLTASGPVTTSSGGSLKVNADGSFQYTPKLGFSGRDSFQYLARSPNASSGSSHVWIHVGSPKGSPRVAKDDEYYALQDSVLSVENGGVLSNEVDPLALPLTTAPLRLPLTAVLPSEPLHGTLELKPDGNFIYTPVKGFVGRDSFTYRARDALSTTAPATVTLNVVKGSNTPPVAVDDQFDVTQGHFHIFPSDVSFGAKSLLSNDSDADGDLLQAILVSKPLHGRIDNGSTNFYPNGAFTYTANPGYSGPDSFSYVVTDGLHTSNVATVSLNVLKFNSPPFVRGDLYVVTKTPLEIPAPGVLQYDTDPDNDPLKAILVKRPAHGSITLREDGSFTYMPVGGFVGTDTFTYLANDGELNSLIADTVVLEVVLTTPPPILASGDHYATAQDSELTGNVLRNDTDPNFLPIFSKLDAGPSHGTLDLHNDGGFSYMPTSGYVGSDSFSYRAHNGQFTSEPATVSIAIASQGGNSAPAANGDLFFAAEGASLTLPGILLNDTDAEHDPLTAGIVDNPLHGKLVPAAGGSFTYIAPTPFNGIDRFTYRASDGRLESNIATVAISVLGVNDPPTFTKGADISVMDTSGPQIIVGWASAMDAGQGEATQELHFVVQANTNKTIFDVQPAVRANGTLVFVPKRGAAGSAQITIVLADDGGVAAGGVHVSKPQTFAINVAYASPWHNRADELDVTGDGSVVAEDALEIINFLNALGAQPAPSSGVSGGPYFDVDNDATVAANDALEIINYLNAAIRGGEGESGESLVCPVSSPAKLDEGDLVALLALDVASQPRRKRP